MPSDEPSPTSPPPDRFQGADCLQRLSAELAVGNEAAVRDEDVVEVLGAPSLAAFRYAQQHLAGYLRKTTREPSFCHSADIGLRAADLGYDTHVVQVGLLHDVVEDRSRDLAGMLRMLDEVRDRFGDRVARDVRLLSNRYSLLVECVGRRLSGELAFSPAALDVVRAALRSYRAELEPAVAQSFAYEFDQLQGYFLSTVSLDEGARRASVDRKYGLLHDLKLQAYGLFVEQLGDHARSATDGRGFDETALVVKSLDLVDNLRTSGVAEGMALERILVKAEYFLDKTFYLHAVVHDRRLPQLTYVALYEYLKHHLVEQLFERRRALAFLADSRFAYLVQYLDREARRLQAKYQVGDDTLAGLAALRRRLRQINGKLDA